MGNSFPSILLKAESVGTSYTSAEFYPSRRLDESGYYQLDWDTVGTFSLALQGKLHEDAEWFSLITVTQADAGLGPETAVIYAFNLCPIMRVTGTTASSADVSVYIHD